MTSIRFLLLGTLAPAAFIHSQSPVELPSIEAKSRGSLLVGEAISSSQGTIGQVDLETRPFLRTGEILEAIPGLIVTQHSGSGKANQYFLRGFNLDHGTDFATWIDGMPINMVSHGHGQGYTDLNFTIPELAESINYLKGSYYAGVGDFSSAGSALINTSNRLERDIVKATIGENDYFRVLAAISREVADGDLLFGIERNTNNGPWDLDEDLDKTNGLLKYSKTVGDQEFSVSLMGYDSSWDSTDQIPQRAVEQGLIDDFGAIDPSVGGTSSRYSLSTAWTKAESDSVTTASAYAIYYDMNLWSNFTYFLDNPDEGDQFEQADRRMIYGASVSKSFTDGSFFDKSATHTFGLQTRFDDVSNVGLFNTVNRQRIGTNRQDALKELSLSAYYETQVTWSPRFRSNVGLRADYFDFDVDSNLAANSGSASDSLISPKLNLVYTPSEKQEFYASAGYSFHSNDARGTTITVDPSDPDTAVDRVDPLVRSIGYEVGVRHYWNERSNTAVALWGLDLDSELLYVGDAGNTEASRPSERYGLEISNYFMLSETISADLDVSFTDAAFGDSDPAGREIPGSIQRVASGGISYRSADHPWFGALRYRHFSGRPLIEDNSARSGSFSAFNLKFGYETQDWQASIDVLNLFDSGDDDITYFYASRLPGEPADGIEDRHYHIIEPRTLRLNIARRF